MSEKFHRTQYFRVFAKRNLRGVQSRVSWVQSVFADARTIDGFATVYQRARRELGAAWVLFVHEISETQFESSRLNGYGDRSFAGEGVDDGNAGTDRK